ncbi:MAG TPA: hypothetical protein VEA69_04615 [Tepidisphaeraceae bacterium]|nr:hypothetical protein [Tepidisphaeraceae bacterium]
MVEPLEGRQMLAADLLAQTGAATAHDAAGRVYAAGIQYTTAGTTEIVVARYKAPSLANPDAPLELDNSFDGDGIAVVPAAASLFLVNDMAVTTDAEGVLRVFVAGGAPSADQSNIDAAVTILTPGTTDGSTGASLHLADVPDSSESANAIAAIGSNGGVVVGGSVFGGGNFVARFTRDGVLDAAFQGTGGTVGYSIDTLGDAPGVGGQSEIKDIAVSGNTIFTAGWANLAGVQSPALAKYDSAGLVDSTVTAVDDGTGPQSAMLTALAVEGDLILAGGAVGGFSTLVARYVGMDLDQDFNGEQPLTVESRIVPRSIASQGETGILIAGYNAETFHAMAGRLLEVTPAGTGPDGVTPAVWELDGDFGPDGSVTAAPEMTLGNGGGAFINTTTGDAIAVGTQFVDPDRQQDVALVRFTTGTPGAAGPVTLLDMSLDGQVDPTPVVGPIAVDLSASAGDNTVEVVVTDGVYQVYVNGVATGSPTLATSVAITTGSGNDHIKIGAGVATSSVVINSGDGNDVIEIDAAVTSAATIDAGAGNDSVVSGAGNDAITAGTGNDTVLAGAGNDTVSGGDGQDVILAEAGNDVVTGGAGADAVSAGDGNDTVSGGAGQDVAIGGKGADSLVGDGENDALVAAYTDHDANVPALKLISGIWAIPNPTDPALARAAYVLKVGVLQATLLRPDSMQGNTVTIAGTVHEDGVADILIGSGGTDWFIVNDTQAGVKDKVLDENRNEIVTDVDVLR